MPGQKELNPSKVNQTSDLERIDATADLEVLTPTPNVTVWQSLRSHIQKFAKDHPYIYAGLILLFVVAIASVFAIALLPAAGRHVSDRRSIGDSDISTNPTPLTRWSPPQHHVDIAHSTPVPNLFLTQSDTATTDTPTPSLEGIQELLNERPTGYLVRVPEDSTLALEGPLFNFSALFDSPTIPSYAFDTIAEATNFNNLYMLPGTTVAGGNWAGIGSNGTYAPGLQFTSAVAVDGLSLTSSYLPSLQIGGISTIINNLTIRFSHAPNVTLQGTLRYFYLDNSLMPYANWSQATFAAATFMGIHMPESDLSGTQVVAIDRRITMDTSFFSNVRATGSDVSGLVLSQVEGFGAGVDGGLNLTDSWTSPGSVITVINSQGQGLTLSLRNMVLDGANITGNFFGPLDLRGTVVPDSATMQYNTAIKEGVTDLGGLTTFGETHLSGKAVRNNQFGRVVCEPQTSECNDLPIPSDCLDTTPDFYQYNALTPECLPNVTLPTRPSTTTVPTTTTPLHNHTQPGGNQTGPHRPGLSALDFSFIAVGSTIAVLLIMLASNSAYKHRKTLCPSLGKSRNSLLGSPERGTSIQDVGVFADERTPLSPTGAEEESACSRFC
jgi:uncharacterized protein YjbI with pentapeptide repeats